MTDDFTLNVIHVDVPLGYGLRRMLDVNMALNLVRRRCVLSGMRDWSIGDDSDDDIPCFACALALAVRLLDHTYLQVRGWSRCRLQVRDTVLDYHTRAGVLPGGVSPNHFQQFQDILQEGVRLTVVDALQPKGLLFKGGSGDKIVSILYFNNHYFPMKGLNTWFGQPYYCVDCEITARSKAAHRCKKDYTCLRCQSKRCLRLPKIHTYCKNCTGMFSNPECYQDHKSNGVCARSTTCDDCGLCFPSTTPEHNCTPSTTCAYCKKTTLTMMDAL